MGTITNKEGDPLGYYNDNMPDKIKTKIKVGNVRWDDEMEDRGPQLPDLEGEDNNYPATLDELIAYARDFHTKCRDTVYEKNRRYATSDDPFSNFYLGGEYGIAIRMTDKVSRLMTLLHPTNKIDGADESIEDTCADLANYAMLLSAMRQHNGSGR